MSSSEDAEIARIAQDVRRYLEAHPNAADTLDGIAQWWLVRQRYGHAKEQVQKALEQLKRERLVLTRTNADGRIIYRSAQRRGVGDKDV